MLVKEILALEACTAFRRKLFIASLLDDISAQTPTELPELESIPKANLERIADIAIAKLSPTGTIPVVPMWSIANWFGFASAASKMDDTSIIEVVLEPFESFEIIELSITLPNHNNTKYSWRFEWPYEL